MSEFSSRLKEARRKAGLTQAQLAKVCGITRGAVALWESADESHRTVPRTELLSRIAAATGVPLNWLMNPESRPEDAWRFVDDSGQGAGIVRRGSDPATSAVADRRDAPGPAPLPVDVIPDFEQDGFLFMFAQTPQQIESKLRAMAAAPAGLKKHLILIGTSCIVHTAETTQGAMSTAIQILKNV